MKVHTREMPCECTEGERSFSQASHSDVAFRCVIQMCHSDVSFRCVIQMCHSDVSFRCVIQMCNSNVSFKCVIYGECVHGEHPYLTRGYLVGQPYGSHLTDAWEFI